MEKFEQLVNKDSDQVFLISCPAYFPFSFARHAWFVINKKSVVSRWEVLHIQGLNIGESWGYIYKNAFGISPFQGIRMFSFSKKYFWKPHLIAVIQNDLLVKKIIETIESTPEEYPFKDMYILRGPNSNTYIQWILNKVPDLKIKLSWRYIGKDFMKK